MSIIAGLCCHITRNVEMFLFISSDLNDCFLSIRKTSFDQIFTITKAGLRLKLLTLLWFRRIFLAELYIEDSLRMLIDDPTVRTKWSIVMNLFALNIIECLFVYQLC